MAKRKRKSKRSGKKRTITPEHLAKMQEGRRRAAQRRAAVNGGKTPVDDTAADKNTTSQDKMDGDSAHQIDRLKALKDAGLYREEERNQYQRMLDNARRR